MKRHLQCAEQQVSRSNLTKYCACHAERLTYLIIITYETSFTMRGATGVTIQPHQILRLPRKMTGLLYRPDIWNVISNARSNRCHYPTSPNTAPATKNDTARFQRKSPKTGETSFPMRGRSDHDPRMIRPWSDHDPTMIRPWKRKPQPASPRRLLFELTTSIFYWKIQRFAPNLTFKHSPSAAPATKSDTTTSRNTAPATKSDTWTSPSTAPATKSDTWTSPNTAPDTKNDSYAWSSLHMKPHFQSAEQQVSLSNLTKYCACHAKWPLNVWQKFAENKWNVISNAGTIRDRSDHDPTMIRPCSDHENANRNPPRHGGYFSSSPRAFSIEKYNVSRPILHSHIHQVLRLPQKVTLELHQVLHLPRKVTLELHQVLHLPRKVTLELHQVLHLPRKVTFELHQVLHLPRKMTPMLDPRYIWNLISNARSNRCHYPTSPNTAPATQNDHLTCGRNLRKTSETSFPMRGRSETDPTMIRPWKRKPQPASPRRLLFELTTSIFYWKIQRFAPNLTFTHSPSTAPATKSDAWTSPSTAPATKSDTWTSPSIAPATKSDIWTSPSTAPATKSDIWTSPSTAPATKSDSRTSPSTAPVTKSDTWTSPSPDSTLLDSTTLFDSTLLDSTLLDFTLLTWLYSTWLYFTWLYDSTLFDTTLIDLTSLYSTGLYSTWLYSNWLNFTGMSFVYRKFLS